MNKFLKLFFYLLLALILIIVTAICYLFFRTSGGQPKNTLLYLPRKIHTAYRWIRPGYKSLPYFSTMARSCTP